MGHKEEVEPFKYGNLQQLHEAYELKKGRGKAP
jgi:hypothetical protein